MKAGLCRSFVRALVGVSIFISSLALPGNSPALTILSGPTFTNSVTAPLAGTLTLTTDIASKISVSVHAGTNTWQRKFHDYSTSHSLPLLGFKPGRTNIITITVEDKDGNEFTAPQPLTFITSPLPSDFPTIVLFESKPEKMEPGYTLFRGVNNTTGKGYLTIVDSAAEVVWYSAATSSLDVRQLSNGNLWIPLPTSIVELNMLGQIVRTLALPSGKPYTHESFPTDHGTILYLSDATRVVTNFPTSSTNPNAPRQTTNVWHQSVIELSATNLSILHTWLPIDMLDPRRIDYLTFTINSVVYGKDWSHANAIIEDPRDDSLIVSLRHQDAVIKFSRATGQLKWILGSHANWGPAFQPYLLNPVGEPFEWQYGQHAPKITPQGTLLLFDDGNFRASPFDSSVLDSNNYSRAVEYQIDEEKMEVSQVWQYGASPAPSIFSTSRGGVEWLDQKGNVLITFGDVSYMDGAPPSAIAPAAHAARFVEVTHEPVPEVVFDFALFNFNNATNTYKGCASYRGNRIRDLYPPAPVRDLNVHFNHTGAILDFTGDDIRRYIIQASTDLVNWQQVGAASSVGNDKFTFIDESSAGGLTRYYRVITQ